MANKTWGGGGKGAKPQKSWTIEKIVAECVPQHPHTCRKHHGPEDGGADGLRAVAYSARRLLPMTARRQTTRQMICRCEERGYI
jgi:hypothetical protein